MRNIIPNPRPIPVGDVPTWAMTIDVNDGSFVSYERQAATPVTAHPEGVHDAPWPVELVLTEHRSTSGAVIEGPLINTYVRPGDDGPVIHAAFTTTQAYALRAALDELLGAAEAAVLPCPVEVAEAMLAGTR